MQESDLTLAVKTEQEAYFLETKKVDIADIRKTLGENVDLDDMLFKVEVKKADKAMQKVVNDVANEQKLEVVGEPISFDVTAKYNGKTKEVTEFSGYIEREINPDSNKRITTAIVVDADGKTRHIPTFVAIKGGKYSAKVNSLTNSVYTLVYNEWEYNDLIGHWSQPFANEMGCRMVFENVETFNPDVILTRKEVAKYVVRALGIKPDANACPFTDVPDDEYKEYIGAAYKYEIVKGVGENMFAPDDSITREQMMAIITNISKRLDLIDASNGNDLSGYVDVDKVGGWALPYVKWNINAGIIVGRSEKELVPKGELTKSEIATVLHRLLSNAELIEK